VETCNRPQEHDSTTSGIGKPFLPYTFPMGRPRKAESASTRDPMAVKIGARIKAARDGKKWKLRELAAHTHLEVSRLGNYETGDRMPGPAEILAIAKATGDSPAFLMALTDDERPQEIRTNEEGALIELFRTVDPEDRERTLLRLGALALLKREAVADAELEHLSAKGKPLTATGTAAKARGRRSTAEK
jgi:transcriptional regulator with XRE-family HTH domain